MGTYLNPGYAKFKKTLDSEIYVDKTEMIVYLNTIVNTEQCYVSVSRPRRFGKSIAANMLCAYYGKGDSRQQFESLKVAGHDSWDKYLNQFDVIKIVMTDFIKNDKEVEEALVKMQKLVTRDIKKRYPDVDYFDTDDLMQSMADVYAETANPFVIIIDEWDAVFRERKEDKDGQRLYLDFLRDWLKDKEYVALAYMTGILPIKKYGKHSALNMFDEYSVMNPMQLAPYTGFTEDEVRELCVKYEMDYEEIQAWGIQGTGHIHLQPFVRSQGSLHRTYHELLEQDRDLRGACGVYPDESGRLKGRGRAVDGRGKGEGGHLHLPERYVHLPRQG